MKVNFTFPQPIIRFGKGVSREIPKAIFKLLDPMLAHIQKAQIDQPKLMVITGKNSIYQSGIFEEIIQICDQNAIKTFVYSKCL